MAYAAGDSTEGMAAAEIYLLEKINQARMNPSKAMMALGLNPDQIIADVPELREILRQGLPALAVSSLLNSSAKSHTADMLKNSYYSYRSADGRTVYERIRGAGYSAAYCDESLGMVRFQNYLAKTSAVDFIFKNMFLDELNSEREESRKILNPLIADIGISFDSGTVTLSGFKSNAYVAACDFGVREIAPALLKKATLQLTQLMNQARREPQAVVEAAGYSPEAFTELIPEMDAVFREGLPVLRKSDALTSVAEDTLSLFSNGTLTDSGDGGVAFLAQSIRRHGYEPEQCLIRVYTIELNESALTPENWSTQFFKKIIAAELMAQRRGDLTALRAEFREIGISMLAREIISDSQAGAATGGLSIAVVYGASTAPGGQSITGLVYKDLNTDGIYTPGEGLSGQRLIIYGAGLHLVTDEAGGFQSSMDPGYYWAILFGGNGSLTVQEVVIKEKSEPAIFVVEDD